MSPIELIESTGAVVRGTHVAYSKRNPENGKWRHGSDYVNKDRVYLDPEVTWALAGFMIQPFLEDGIEAIIVPAVGAVPLSQPMALQLQRHTGRRIIGPPRSAWTAADGWRQRH